MIIQIKIFLKNSHLKSLTHIQFGKQIQINHTFENPDIFDVDEISCDFITHHIKKFGLCLVKCDFKLVFNTFTSHIKTDFQYNTSITNLKRYLLY